MSVFPKRLSLIALALFSSLLPASVSAQIVVPDAERWTDKECRWLHRQALDACKNLTDCTDTSDMPMSTQRGLSALDNIFTVRNGQDFDGLCLKVCETKKIPTYSAFNKEFCATVKSR